MSYLVPNPEDRFSRDEAHIDPDQNAQEQSDQGLHCLPCLSSSIGQITVW